MSGYRYKAVIVKNPEDAGYYAFVPALQGCVTDGETIDEIKQNLREAIELYLETLADHDDPIPDPRDDQFFIEDIRVSVSA